jgi:hypothetical protein
VDRKLTNLVSSCVGRSMPVIHDAVPVVRGQAVDQPHKRWWGRSPGQGIVHSDSSPKTLPFLVTSETSPQSNINICMKSVWEITHNTPLHTTFLRAPN